MKLRILTFIISVFCSLSIVGQPTGKDSVFIKINNLKRLLSQADTLRPENLSGDSNIDINGLITKQLTEILSIPTITNYNLDSLLKHPFLEITHSIDNRLWIFDWYENTGGTFQSNISIVYYRNESNKSKISIDASLSEATNNVFSSNGAWFNNIYKLKSVSKDLYLCMGSIKGCSSCCSEIAIVVELAHDSIYYEYPAFTKVKQDSQNFDYKSFSPCFSLDARCGDIEKFEYDPKTQTINFTYFTDDYTPIKKNDSDQKKIRGELKFNGETFVGSGYKTNREFTKNPDKK